MGREVKKVSLDFNWPLGKVWKGFLNPYYYGHTKNCPFCNGRGESKRAKELSDLWYGYVEFNPRSTGSEPFTSDDPSVVEQAEWHIHCSRFGITKSITPLTKELRDSLDQKLVKIEAMRLCDIYNTHWSRHLSQEDVDALWKSGRLNDFKKKPTAKQVNQWAIGGMGHDSCNQWICVKARCKKEKVSPICSYCKGHGTLWESKEYERKSNEWKSEEPPTGDGFQIWETVSEGSPISPVFAKPEDLAQWMVANDKSITRDTTCEQWVKFITDVGWSPSMVMEHGEIKSGVNIMAEKTEKT